MLVKQIRMNKQFRPPAAGDNMYGSAIPHPIDIPIGVSIGVVQGAGDVWCGIFYRIVTKENSSSARASWSRRRGDLARRNILITGAVCGRCV